MLPERPHLSYAALVVVGLAVTIGLLVAGVPATEVPFLAPGGQQPNSDTVQFRERALACGLEYRTAGGAYGSDDGGVAIGDYDRDGRPDVLAIGGTRPMLFENSPDGFERSGALPDGGYPALKSALFFDADGDGWRDLLLIPRVGEPIYLTNDNGTYARSAVGFDRKLQWGTGAAAADYDRDGDLDVYLIQNGDWREGTPRRGASGAATDGYPNMLFENTADGFEQVNGTGIGGSYWSLATSFVDLTDDGYPDIYVANDYGWDYLLVNQGNGTFDRRKLSGTNMHGMASVIRDVNGDGRLDVFVTNIQFENPGQVWELNSGLNVRNRGNTLLVNRGKGTFVDRAGALGVRQGGWGWAASIEDFDNDGTLDIMHATKYYLQRSTSGGFTTIETTPSLWEGIANGSFERRKAAEAGLVPSNGRGLATADFDLDGDLDVIVADTTDRFKLYENVDEGGNWLQVRVRVDDGIALGARVVIETGSGSITRVQSSRSGFFSQSSRTLHVGLGSRSVDRLRVVFPDGTERVFEDVGTNRRVLVSKGGIDPVGNTDGAC